VTVRAAHEIPGMQVSHEIGPVAEEKQTRVIPVGAEETRGNLDEAGREQGRHVVALREGLAERLFHHDDALGGDGDNLGRHAAEGMDQQDFLEQGAVVAELGIGQQASFLAAAESEFAPDMILLARQVELVDGTVGFGGERPGFHSAADAPKVGVGFFKGVFRGGQKTEIVKRPEGEKGAEGADGLTQGGPFGPGPLEETYFVFLEEDEIAVRICAETAFGRRRAESSERFQSSLVIVLKSDSFGNAEERAPPETGRLAGEGVLHGSLMSETSRPLPAMAKGFCRQFTRNPRMRRSPPTEGAQAS